MKIAAIRNFLTVKAGAQGAFMDMMRALRKNGHEIDIYVLNISNNFRKEISKEFNVASLGFKEWEFKFISPIVNYLRAIPQFKKFAHRINGGGYDIAFIDHFHLSPLILPFLHIPKVYYCYEPPRTYYEPFWTSTARAKILKSLTFIVKFLDARCVRFADLILCPSDFSRECIWRAYGLFATTNYLGVDTNKYKKLTDVKKENMALSVGVILQHKAHDFTVRSIGLISNYKRPKLVIIAVKGVSKEKERLLNLAKLNGVDLEIKEYVPDEEFVELHNIAKVVAIPFIMEPSIEPVALACETPIVAVREGGARETIINNETGILTERDEKQFALAIEYLLDNPDKAAEIGRKGRRWIMENFTWEKCAAVLQGNFEQVLLRSK